MKKKNLKTSIPFLKIILSLWIVYHLLVIIIMPHKQSPSYLFFRPYLTSYARSLSMDSNWKSDTLDPGRYFYLEYDVTRKNSIETYQWPPSRKESKRVFFNHNRLIAHSRFFLNIRKRYIRRAFLPYLCRLHPSAEEISLRVLLKKHSYSKKAPLSSFSFSAKKPKQREWLIGYSSCRKERRKTERMINNIIQGQ